MEDYKSILVPIDLSEASRMAFEKALSFAKLVKGRVTIVHVAEPVILTYTGYTGGIEVTNAINVIENENISGVRKYLEKLQAEARDFGVDCHVRIEKGNVQSTLVEISGDYDLIIMGTQGRGMVSSILLGSVAEYVSRHAACPVMLVRKKGKPRA
jgi:nucleotide-binding universal stress UspA family protein